MIKISNLIKVYNKGQTNQIKAIDGIGLNFPDKGLVCFLGPSGCGKTTLLNAIGGLDKVDSGTITIGENVITKYKADYLDKIRNEHIGYIFQNYILFPDLSVFDNLSLVLKMFDLSSQEINERIEYALKAVNMEKYKKRLCKNLSGGQMQRVAIARALVKSPDIIIADEPTGNLDGKNTTQIMNIIKKLSKECLVILVTHERKLASFYGDLIIEIVDGRVVNKYENKSSQSYEYEDDQNIYLGEFLKKEEKDGIVSYNLYGSDEVPKLNLNVIYKNNVFYIKAASENNNQIRYIQQDDEVNIIDSEKPKVDLDYVDKFEYFMPKIKKTTNNKNVIKFKDTFKTAFRHVSSFRLKQRFFLFSFAITAIFVVIAFANLSKVFGINESEYIVGDNNTITVAAPDITYNDVIKIKDNVSGSIIPTSNNLQLQWVNFSMFNQSEISSIGSEFIYEGGSTVYPLTDLKESIVYGEMPSKNKQEVLVDSFIIDELLKSQYSNIKYAGAYRYEQFIGQSITLDVNATFIITGIIDSNSPSLYIDDDLLMYLYIRNKAIFDYSFDVDTYSNITEYKDLSGTTKKLTDLKLNEGEVIVNSNIKSQTIEFLSGGRVYNVVGTFEAESGFYLDAIIQTVNFSDLMYHIFSMQEALSIHSNDKKKDLRFLNTLEIDNIKVFDTNKEALRNYRQENLGNTTSFVIFTSLTLVLSLIFMFLTMRSSLISRVYEVGVYRALGVRKKEVKKIFISEIAIITLISSFVGYLIASIFIWRINITLQMHVISYPWYMALIALVFILVCNFSVGMIPITILLRKTPTEILTKYDI